MEMKKTSLLFHETKRTWNFNQKTRTEKELRVRKLVPFKVIRVENGGIKINF